MSTRLTALLNEQRSLDSKRFLSTRQQRRRETLLRQIDVTRLQLEREVLRREERRRKRLETQSQVAEFREERKQSSDSWNTAVLGHTDRFDGLGAHSTSAIGDGSPS